MTLHVSIKPTTDFTLEPWSYSRLTDLNTCETWGFVRGALRKSFPSVGRSMALEAGSAAHEAFAAYRLYQLLQNGHRAHFEYHTRRIFGAERGAALVARVREPTNDTLGAIAFAADVLHSSGFYDDPSDNRRTLANIEEAIYEYGKHIYSRSNPVWVQDVDRPDSMVGVELPFDFTLEMKYEHFMDGALRPLTTEYVNVRYIGTIDAIHVSKEGKPYIEENKTASRLGDAWANSFETSHQVTGYMVFASMLTGVKLTQAQIIGISLPQPRRASAWTEGVRKEVVSRDDHNIAKFFQWVYGTYLKRVRIGTDVENALQETHSCNRYFQACSLIPFCKGSPDDRKEMLDEMTALELSPSETAVLEKSGD